MVPGNYPRIMGTRRPGPGTATGEGDIIYDDRGCEYRVVSMAEAQQINSSTGGHVYKLHPDGTVR